MTYDYAKRAREVIEAVGSPENVRCATRLRLIVVFFWYIITLTGVQHIFNMLEIRLLSNTGFNLFF
ncbi:MAG: PTS transporter subunit EIIB [Lawsonibacter sp.]|nr:PTS transporter subunit EIIB [Lawsonibacter sp.]